MHSTPCDLSPQPWLRQWCPLHWSPCWSREQRGHQGNRTTWPLFSFLPPLQKSPRPAGGDVWICEILKFRGEPQTEGQTWERQVDRTILSFIYLGTYFAFMWLSSWDRCWYAFFPCSWCWCSVASIWPSSNRIKLLCEYSVLYIYLSANPYNLG